MLVQSSGTVDLREPDDDACITRIRALVDKIGSPNVSPFSHSKSRDPLYSSDDIYGLFSSDPGKQYDMREIIADRKSTRLNSSHQIISYAVFCLKKKNNTD